MKRPRSFRTIGGAIAVDFRADASAAPSAGPELRAIAGGFTAECSKGWGARCAGAHGPTCRCACGGQNHGTACPVDSGPLGHHDAWGTTRRPRSPHQLELRTMARTPRAHYAVETRTEKRVILRDLGPWTEYRTITNDAEHVVRELIANGQLQPGQRLFYFDSGERFDEIVVTEGRFVCFASATFDPNEDDDAIDDGDYIAAEEAHLAERRAGWPDAERLEPLRRRPYDRSADSDGSQH